MSAADNIKCDIRGKNHHPMTECQDALRSLASAAGSRSLLRELFAASAELRFAETPKTKQCPKCPHEMVRHNAEYNCLCGYGEIIPENA